MNPIEKAAYLLRASGHPIAAAELEAEIARLKPGPGQFGVWTSMEDCAPPEEGEYLVVVRSDEGLTVTVDDWGEREAGTKTWFDWTWFDPGQVIHWMPLPEAPR